MRYHNEPSENSLYYSLQTSMLLKYLLLSLSYSGGIEFDLFSISLRTCNGSPQGTARELGEMGCREAQLDIAYWKLKGCGTGCLLHACKVFVTIHILQWRTAHSLN